jgi:hypothetical protein
MHTNCEQHEFRGGSLVGKSEAEIEKALLEAYMKGFDDGVEDAKHNFLQTQMLLMMTAGNA